MLRAFHGKREIKDKYVALMEFHIALDHLQAGSYTNHEPLYLPDGVPNRAHIGCAVGCLFNSSSHLAYEEQIGFPFQLGLLHDACFEGLWRHVSKEVASAFALDFLAKTTEGADLSLVIWHYLLWLAEDELDVMAGITGKKWLAIKTDLIDLIKRRIAGQTIGQDEFRDRTAFADLAYLAYRDALDDRADLDDRAYRADLADRAYRAYLAALADLAYLADRADLAYLADRAALDDWWRANATKLLELLASAPVPVFDIGDSANDT